MIGGLIVATVTTLVFVPCVFAILHGSEAAVPPEALHERHGEASTSGRRRGRWPMALSPWRLPATASGRAMSGRPPAANR